MEMTMRKVLLAALIVGCSSFGAVTAITASGQRTPAHRASAGAGTELRDAFPAFATAPAAPDTRFPSNSKVLATARIAGDPEVVLGTTSDHQICFTARNSGTCQDQPAVISAGMFIAAVACRSGSVQATVIGVVPAGVDEVATSQGDVKSAPSSAGVVELNVPNADFDALHLSNGKTHPLRIGKDKCAPGTVG
jgi:hypothetical protein